MSYACFEAGGSSSRRQIIPCYFTSLLVYIALLYYDARCKKHKIRKFEFRAMSENNIANERICGTEIILLHLKIMYCERFW